MDDTDLAAARAFHARLVDLLRAEFSSLGTFLEALAEFDRRKLFRDLGHANLFMYLHKGLGLSRAAAHHRRAGAWLVQRFPEVLEPIREGKLCFTTAAVLASVATEENLAAVLPRFYGLSKKEALELAAELKPRTVVPTRTLVTRVQASRPVEPPVAQAHEVKQAVPGIRPGELGMPRTEVERPAVERTLVVPMTATSSRFHVTVSREFLALLKKAKAGESHRSPGAPDEEILTAALKLLIEKQSRRKACVPAKVKREVMKRDEGKCQWKRPDGGVCGATVRLEIDHVVPRGKGGPSTVENCRILCLPQSRSRSPGLRRRAHGPLHPWFITGRCPPGTRGRRCLRGGIRSRQAAPEPTERYDTGTMCRLFGQLSDAHRTASVPLCSAENALRTQSHLHPHGWGIAWYGAGGPRVRRGVMAAHADDDFVRAGKSARSRIVLAHVRDASVGRVALENTHPFVEGPWVFAHNGTVARYKRSRVVREALLAAISPLRRRALAGETDSERCFQLFLSRLDLRTGRGRATVEDVRTAMADTVAIVRAFADRGELRSTLNFLVSDGRLLCACRNGKPLHVSTGTGPGRIFAVASEPIGRSGWECVPEGGFVGVDGALRATRSPLGISLPEIGAPGEPAAPAPGPARRAAPQPRR